MRTIPVFQISVVGSANLGTTNDRNFPPNKRKGKNIRINFPEVILCNLPKWLTETIKLTP
jgi:hypothetical protein